MTGNVADIFRRDDGVDAGSFQRRRRVDRTDAAVGERSFAATRRAARLRSHVVDKFTATAQEAQVLQAFRSGCRSVGSMGRGGCHRYSIFTPAAFTTSPHFTRWARVKAVKASGFSESTEIGAGILSFIFVSFSFYTPLPPLLVARWLFFLREGISSFECRRRFCVLSEKEKTRTPYKLFTRAHAREVGRGGGGGRA